MVQLAEQARGHQLLAGRSGEALIADEAKDPLQLMREGHAALQAAGDLGQDQAAAGYEATNDLAESRLLSVK